VTARWAGQDQTLREPGRRKGHSFNALVQAAPAAAGVPPSRRRSVVELLIVDEADRLKMPDLAELRDRSHRANFRDGVGVILTGRPGIEKRLARYAQL